MGVLMSTVNTILSPQSMSLNFWNPQIGFITNHCNKSYNKEDLNNPFIFNIELIKKDFELASPWSQEKTMILEQCVNIVTLSNDELTLTLLEKETELPFDIDFIVKLHNITKNVTYTIKEYFYSYNPNYSTVNILNDGYQIVWFASDIVECVTNMFILE